jgi:hypothetical protein
MLTMVYQGDPRSHTLLTQLYPPGESHHLRLGSKLARFRAPHTLRGTRGLFLPDAWSLRSTLRAIKGGGFPDRSRPKSQFLKQASGYAKPVSVPDGLAAEPGHVTRKEVTGVGTQTDAAAAAVPVATGTDPDTVPWPGYPSDEEPERWSDPEEGPSTSRNRPRSGKCPLLCFFAFHVLISPLARQTLHPFKGCCGRSTPPSQVRSRSTSTEVGASVELHGPSSP